MAKQKTSAETLARGLGWFSIGLGAAELLAPRSLARGIGLRGHGGLVGAYGLREVGTGIGILAARDPGPWVWARVAGDVLDLGTVLAGMRHRRVGAGLALAAVAGVTMLDITCALQFAGRRTQRTTARSYADRRGMPRPPEAMRGAARDFEVPADMRIPEPLRPYAV